MSGYIYIDKIVLRDPNPDGAFQIGMTKNRFYEIIACNKPILVGSLYAYTDKLTGPIWADVVILEGNTSIILQNITVLITVENEIVVAKLGG